MKTVTIIGFVLVAAGLMLFVGLVLLTLLFTVGSHTSPLSSPLREVVTLLFTLSLYWFIPLGLGAVLVVAGVLQRRRQCARVRGTAIERGEKLLSERAVSRLLPVGTALHILVACVSLLMSGYYSTTAVAMGLNELAVLMVVGFATSVVMAVGGFFAIRRKRFPFVLAGPLLLISWYASIAVVTGEVMWLIIFASLLLAVVTLLAKSRKEFT